MEGKPWRTSDDGGDGLNPRACRDTQSHTPSSSTARGCRSPSRTTVVTWKSTLRRSCEHMCPRPLRGADLWQELWSRGPSATRGPCDEASCPAEPHLGERSGQSAASGQRSAKTCALDVFYYMSLEPLCMAASALPRPPSRRSQKTALWDTGMAAKIMIAVGRKH